MLRQLGTAAESRRRRELEWLLRRLPQLSDRERALVDQMSHRLVAGILHAPRAALGSGDEELAPAARRLFDL
jgi:glutamyl-tRNA reductase